MCPGMFSGESQSLFLPVGLYLNLFSRLGKQGNGTCLHEIIQKQTGAVDDRHLYLEMSGTIGSDIQTHLLIFHKLHISHLQGFPFREVQHLTTNIDRIGLIAVVLEIILRLRSTRCHKHHSPKASY